MVLIYYINLNKITNVFILLTSSTFLSNLQSKEKGGAPVELKEVFDRTHMIKTPEGQKKYVNGRAEKAAVSASLSLLMTKSLTLLIF